MSNVSLDLEACMKFYMASDCSIKDEHKLHLVLQSFNKRVEYNHYYYQQFFEATDLSILLSERLDSRPIKRELIRVTYEANVTSFLSNLHALIDSIPYLINLLEERVESDGWGIAWKRKFINRYAESTFYEDIVSVYNDKNLWRLKGLVNQSKHQYLPRIKNTFSSIVFEKISYEIENDAHVEHDIPVKAFMAECHDCLIPKVIKLLNRVIDVDQC